ncbi:MAG: hypothetical protein WDN04_27080 [Rhodospirillales bacterium]
MAKLSTGAAAITAMFSTAALAQPVLTPGEYYGVTQYTGLVDPSGICANSAASRSAR